MEIVYGINVMYVWEFGDGENVIILSLWVMYVYRIIGIVIFNVMVINKVSLMFIWCIVVI